MKKLTQSKKNNVQTRIYPFIDELVDSLYTDEINNIIESENVKVDKKTFFMFIIMYFVTRLSINNVYNSKENIKLIMTDIIRDPIKRSKCIEIFLSFQKNMNNIFGTLESIVDETLKIEF